MQRISTPLDQIKEHYDVVVVGSGYGGSIAASRMARAGRSVCLLERGREFIAGDFPDTLTKASAEFQVSSALGHVGSRTGLFELHVNEHQNVVVGCGLGGTSLINANVSLEPDASVFTDPGWPSALLADRETLLKEGYERAREMLRPKPYPQDWPALRKLQAHRKSAEALGAAENFYRPPINVDFDSGEGALNHVGVEQKACTNCGDCVSGCNVTAKNTTRMNYLPDAWNHGAEIYCQASVRHVERQGDGWLVHFQYVGTGREAFSAPTLFVHADIVVLSAGTLGSTEILLRSREQGLACSDQLGLHMSGNGDMLGFGYNCEGRIDGIGYGDEPVPPDAPVGPCITSIIDLRDQQDRVQRMVIEEGSLPGAIGSVLGAAFKAAAAALGEDKDSDDSLLDNAKDRLRELDSVVRGPYHGAVNNTQTFLVMSHDDGAGRMLLRDDRLRVEWPGVGEQENFRIGSERLETATAALDGVYVPNPMWNKLMNHAVVTVHPLGGCVMADDAGGGVVNHKGQVYSGSAGDAVHTGLYVTDGAVLPTSLAVNPLLTISAVSERAMRLLAQDRGWQIDYTLPSAPRRAAKAATLGIEFTETMRGHYSPQVQTFLGTDLAAYEAAGQAGEAAGSFIDFTLTVSAPDLDRLINDPSHPATIVGTVTAPALAPEPLVASQGVFNLFQAFPDQPGVRHMNYNMKLTARDGSDYYFSAFKVVPEDHNALAIWADTSTLYITLHQGEDRSGAVVGAGVMHIKPGDFAKQMTTMKVLNADGELERLGALARFGRHFAGVLWDSYGPGAGSR